MGVYRRNNNLFIFYASALNTIQIHPAVNAQFTVNLILDRFYLYDIKISFAIMCPCH